MTPERYPSDAAERVQVRLPDGLRERLKAAAAANGRSMNNEIVSRLLASFEAPQTLHPGIAVAIDAYVEASVSERLREFSTAPLSKASS